ncbi:hypothetical protein [Campylobacter sp.]|uniref:hypothetical protein n=1 Tax=Campylobacter sp. TaxID=205 RepID=UPI0026DD7BB5|nr:hypothetical protein [Campylobacter sp.]MDO4674840.1 hypothetical protein [Campylobacter sp.]
MRKLALLAAICNAFLVGNLKAGENRLYNYHTNPYSVHRPYRPGYFNNNNYHYNAALCANWYGFGTIGYKRCLQTYKP